ncbi:MAG: tRNA pseudouridine(55) synthase TruB [Bacteroidota bacterium]
MDFLEGQTLLFNKPKSWTSFDLVKKIRNTVKIKKVGHAGTLDPLATGLLIICTGKHTKRINTIQDLEKEYLVTFKLGAVTASFDMEEKETDIKDASQLTQIDLETAMAQFEGELEQIPPAFSAVKVNGKRAYESARKGKKIILPPRAVSVYEFSLQEFSSTDEVIALVRCSKGTYIRSLIHDLGQALSVGAYIRELCRTRIGDYMLEDAWEITEFVDKYRISSSTHGDTNIHM